jgi:predicted transcriptional regulator
LSESKIILYLEQTATEFCYIGKMSVKLNMDYGYIIKVLNLLENKEWIKGAKIRGKKFYCLTKKTPIEKAKERFMRFMEG